MHLNMHRFYQAGCSNQENVIYSKRWIAIKHKKCLYSVRRAAILHLNMYMLGTSGCRTARKDAHILQGGLT